TEQRKVTQFFMNLSDQLKMLSGFIRETFYKSLERVFNGFKGAPLDKFNELMNKLKDTIAKVSDRFANWLKNFVESGQLESFGRGIAKVAEISSDFALKF